MKALGVFLVLLAGAIFYGAFFKLAPWITSLIPITSDWQPLLKIAIYIVIGYLGGIGLPLALLVYGFIFLFVKER